MSTYRAIAAILCLFVLSACEPAKPKAETFYDGQFGITRPATWSVRDDLNDEADIQMGNTRREAYAVVLTEARIDFADEMSLEGFGELTRTGLMKSLRKPVLGEAESLSINGHRAIRHELTGNVESIKIRYWHVVIDTGDHYHQLMMWSLPSMFDNNKTDFNLVMSSIEVL